MAPSPSTRGIPTRPTGLRRRLFASAVSFALAVGMLVGFGGASPTTAAATPKTIVSLTFDDGNDDQFAAAQVMMAHGLVGTFFITTSWIGLPTYLTQANLHSMAADGNEIGGHTVTHPDLTTLSTAAATAEVCNGRTTLAGWGFTVTDFAYPFAAENAAVEQVVKNCGYTSARNLGDIRSPASCPACPYAEAIPPANPYNMAAPDEVDSTWTLQNLQGLVTNAETHGGGWVQLTLHHIAVGTDPTLTISPTLFDQFAAWLAARTATGTTVVQTVAQALGTTPTPPASGPGSVMPVPPARIMDTRTNLGGTGLLPAFGTMSLQVTGKGGVPASGVSAVVVNVTAVTPTAAGFLTVWPSGTPQQQTSNLNFQAGQTIPNLVVVPVGADGKIQLFNGSPGPVQLLADASATPWPPPPCPSSTGQRSPPTSSTG